MYFHNRKVAAISGDARRALDICRRAIDLIKSEDDSQLITINHVDQVLNSILSGVRVTAIRYVKTGHCVDVYII
jgi:origin recognition complex subunit 1